MKDKNKKGFTLVELLIVVLIIGILAAIALPSYLRAVEKGRASSPMTNLAAIAKAEKANKLARLHYTDQVQELDISLNDVETGSQATGNTFDSDFFRYKLYGDDKAAAVATRKNTTPEETYELSVDYETGRIYCRPITHSVCIDLNLEEGPNYSSKYDTSNIQNWVMKDYVMYAIEELSQLWQNGCGKDLTCLTDGEMCSDDGEGTCLNAVAKNTWSTPSNYVIGADGNKYFWGMHDGYLTFNINNYGDNPFFAQIFFYPNGGMNMRIGSGSSNPGFNEKLAEVNEYLGDRHFLSNSGWNYYSIPESIH